MLISQRIPKSTLPILFSYLTEFNSPPASPAGSQNPQCNVGTTVGMYGLIMQIQAAIANPRLLRSKRLCRKTLTIQTSKQDCS